MKQLTKIHINPDSKAPQSTSIEEYRIDQERGTWGQFFEGKSPPIEYTVIGDVIGDIKVGACLIMRRYFRSVITGQVLGIDGVMHTSEIKGIEHAEDCTYITTANSVYKLQDHIPTSNDQKNNPTEDV